MKAKENMSSAKPSHCSSSWGSLSAKNLYFVSRRVHMKTLLLVWFETLRPSQQCFSHVVTFSWVELVLSNEDGVSCSRTQHHASGEIRTRDLVIKSLALS